MSVGLGGNGYGLSPTNVVSSRSVVGVTNINDPSPELNARQGNYAGELIIARQDNAGDDDIRLYIFDPGSSVAENPPFTVDASGGGVWIMESFVSPSSATDNQIASFDGTSGRQIQGRDWQIDDAGDLIPLTDGNSIGDGSFGVGTMNFALGATVTYDDAILWGTASVPTVFTMGGQGVGVQAANANNVASIVVRDSAGIDPHFIIEDGSGVDLLTGGHDDTNGFFTLRNVSTGDRINLVGGAASTIRDGLILSDLTASQVVGTNGSSQLISLSSVDSFVSNASTTVQGKIEIATVAEVDTGTDATRAVSPDSLAGSYAGTKTVQIEVFRFETSNPESLVAGDGAAFFHITAALDGMNLVAVHAEVNDASTSGLVDIQINNVTQAADMLSTSLTIDANETGSDTAATPAVIDTANDDVAENDLIRIDMDGVGTAAAGLLVTCEFRLP